MRQVEWFGAPVDSAFVDAMDSCVQCRGCETACPSAVPFGRLMETTRERLTERTSYQPRYRRLAYRALGWPRVLAAGSTALAVLQRLRVVPSARLGLPRIPLRRPELVDSGDDVWLFTGCVMDLWQRDVHAAAKRVIEATGAGVRISGASAPCCGALHEHAGLGRQARRLAARVIEAMAGDQPVLVDAAGCGAMLKDYGHLVGTPEAVAFSARVLDVHEWLADHLDELPEPVIRRAEPVAVQDPCHLRHVQRSHQAVRDVLARFVEIVELDDEGLCCGAGGAYSVLRREWAVDIRNRKLASIGRTGAALVASANPGCAMHLASAGLDLRHPVQLVDEALGLGS